MGCHVAGGQWLERGRDGATNGGGSSPLYSAFRVRERAHLMFEQRRGVCEVRDGREMPLALKMSSRGCELPKEE